VICHGTTILIFALLLSGMNKIKCNSCGFVDFSDAKVCKKCGKSLFASARATRVSAELGQLKLESGLSMYVIILLAISGALMLATAVLYAAFRKSQAGGDEMLIAFILFTAVPVLCCGYALTFFWGKKKVKVFENGLELFEKGIGTATVLWDDIAKIHEHVEWLLIQGIPVGRGVQMDITTKSGATIALMQDIGGLAAIRTAVRDSAHNAEHARDTSVNIYTAV